MLAHHTTYTKVSYLQITVQNVVGNGTRPTTVTYHHNHTSAGASRATDVEASVEADADTDANTFGYSCLKIIQVSSSPPESRRNSGDSA